MGHGPHLNLFTYAESNDALMKADAYTKPPNDPKEEIECIEVQAEKWRKWREKKEGKKI